MPSKNTTTFLTTTTNKATPVVTNVGHTVPPLPKSTIHAKPETALAVILTAHSVTNVAQTTASNNSLTCNQKSSNGSL